MSHGIFWVGFFLIALVEAVLLGICFHFSRKEDFDEESRLGAQVAFNTLLTIFLMLDGFLVGVFFVVDKYAKF